ncbi:MAG: type II toxin-antitoxin system RelE/ParE family toxin [Acidobacteriia bacterium]|nr:type II toxin-antitoxin system RelE/ParE family toxin [Terriglobia bacterium]
MTVRWTPTALRDLESLHAYIRNDNPSAADEAVEKILAGIEALSQHPEMGRIGRVTAIRELVLPPMIVAYKLRRRALEMLAIIHGARKWPDKFR